MMASETEVKLKFMVPRQGFAALAADMCLGTVRVRRLLAIYYDWSWSCGADQRHGQWRRGA